MAKEESDIDAIDLVDFIAIEILERLAKSTVCEQCLKILVKEKKRIVEQSSRRNREREVEQVILKTAH